MSLNSNNNSDALFDNLIAVEELASKLGVKRKSVVNQLSLGKLPGLKIGKKWFLSRESLDRHFSENTFYRKQKKRRKQNGN